MGSSGSDISSGGSGGWGVKYSRGGQCRLYSEGEGGVGGVVVAATAAEEQGTREEGVMSRLQLLKPCDGSHGIGKRKRGRKRGKAGGREMQRGRGDTYYL